MVEGEREREREREREQREGEREQEAEERGEQPHVCKAKTPVHDKKETKNPPKIQATRTCGVMKPMKRFKMCMPRPYVTMYQPCSIHTRNMYTRNKPAKPSHLYRIWGTAMSRRRQYRCWSWATVSIIMLGKLGGGPPAASILSRCTQKRGSYVKGRKIPL